MVINISFSSNSFMIVTQVNFDNEHSELEYYTDESGQEYLIQSTNHDFCISWDNGEYIFKITSNLNKKDTLSLCKSTKSK